MRRTVIQKGEESRMFLKLPPSDVPLFHSCGCLVSNEPFLHADRMNSDYLLIIGMKETLHLLVNDEPVDVAPHEMLIIPPFTPHCGKAPSENITFFWCHFWLSGDEQLLSDEEAFDLYEQFSNHRSKKTALISCRFALPNMARVYVFCKQLLDYAATEPRMSRKINSYLTAAMLLELSDQSEYSNQTAFKNRQTLRFEYVAEWVRINACRNMTMQEIGDSFSYNPNYLSNLFRRETGLSLKQYIISARMDLAKEYLLLTDLPIQAIAQRVGYHDEKYFMKVFKTREILTPTDYRNAYSRSCFQKHSSMTPRTTRNVKRENSKSIRQKENGRLQSGGRKLKYQMPSTNRAKETAHYYKYACPHCERIVYAPGEAQVACRKCNCDMVMKK